MVRWPSVCRSLPHRIQLPKSNIDKTLQTSCQWPFAIWIGDTKRPAATCGQHFSCKDILHSKWATIVRTGGHAFAFTWHVMKLEQDIARWRWIYKMAKKAQGFWMEFWMALNCSDLYTMSICHTFGPKVSSMHRVVHRWPYKTGHTGGQCYRKQHLDLQKSVWWRAKKKKNKFVSNNISQHKSARALFNSNAFCASMFEARTCLTGCDSDWCLPVLAVQSLWNASPCWSRKELVVPTSWSEISSSDIFTRVTREDCADSWSHCYDWYVPLVTVRVTMAHNSPSPILAFILHTEVSGHYTGWELTSSNCNWLIDSKVICHSTHHLEDTLF